MSCDCKSASVKSEICSVVCVWEGVRDCVCVRLLAAFLMTVCCDTLGPGSPPDQLVRDIKLLMTDDHVVHVCEQHGKNVNKQINWQTIPVGEVSRYETSKFQKSPEITSSFSQPVVVWLTCYPSIPCSSVFRSFVTLMMSMESCDLRL